MVEGAALEMLCSQKEPRVRIPNSPPKSPVNQGFSGLFFFGKNKAISGILAYSNLKNQFFPSSSEISIHLLPKFTDSGSAIPLTIAFAEDNFEV